MLKTRRLHYGTEIVHHRPGVPKLSLAMYPFSISIDEHAPLKFV